jgi:hypothetical protein
MKKSLIALLTLPLTACAPAGLMPAGAGQAPAVDLSVLGEALQEVATELGELELLEDLDLGDVSLTEIPGGYALELGDLTLSVSDRGVSMGDLEIVLDGEQIRIGDLITVAGDDIDIAGLITVSGEDIDVAGLITVSGDDFNVADVIIYEGGHLTVAGLEIPTGS